MKQTLCIALALTAFVLIAGPATTAEEAGRPAAAVQAAAAPAPAETFDLVEALQAPAATPAASEPSLSLEPERMACVPSECPCPAGFRCLAKCCVPR